MATLAPDLARYSRVAIWLHWIIAALIALNLLLGFFHEDFERPVRAAMISSQMLGIGLARYILQFPPVVNMSEDELVTWLGPTIQRTFGRSLHIRHLAVPQTHHRDLSAAGSQTLTT